MNIIGNPIIVGEKSFNYEWHQCPEAVRRYINYVKEHPYNSNDYSYTYINDSTYGAPLKANASDSNTKPVKLMVNNVAIDGTQDIEPLKKEPYIINNKTNTIKALDSLRWYNTTNESKTTGGAPEGAYYNGGSNCRDLGGWACDGGTIKYGMLIRSGELNPRDKELMVDKIGVRTEINLLPTDYQATEKFPWGTEGAINPSTRDFMYSIANNVKDQWELYLKTTIKSIVYNKPVIFHCGAGADKTGTFAVMLMGILGCSLSDIDIDFELTAFAHPAVDSHWRNRTYSSYVNFINAINNVPLIGGLSNTFRNHCISFALSLGVSVDEINLFRKKCSTGTPETISVSLSSYTITNNLTNIINSNSLTTITPYQEYEAELSIDSNIKSHYHLDSVSIIMNGVNVTSSYYSNQKIYIPIVTGNIIINASATSLTSYSITNNLTNCKTTNIKNSVYSGEGFVEDIEVDVLGGFDDLSNFTVTMGGVDITAQAVTLISNINYSITYNLSHCSSSNTLNLIQKNSSYSTTLTASSGYNITSVVVRMGNNDITSSAYNSTNNTISINNVTGEILITVTTAEIVINNYSITYNLSNCASNNVTTTIAENSSYSMTLTADSNYNIDTVTVSMGGTDITSTAYNSSNNTISISSVTGNVVITATATQGSPYTNLAAGSSSVDSDWKMNYRLSSSAGGNYEIAKTGVLLTNLIQYSSGDLLYIYGLGNLSSSDSANRIGIYSSHDTSVAPILVTAGKTTYFTRSYDSTTGITTLTMNSNGGPYIRFGCKPVVAENEIIITRNESIV